MSKQPSPSLRFNGFVGAWEEKYLNEIGDFFAGGDIKKEKLKPFGSYPVLANALTNNSIVGFYDDYEFESPAITITGRGDVGVAKARKENFSAVVRLLVLKNKPNYDVDFLEQVINKIDFHIESTGVPQLTVPQCKSYSIYSPDFPEQTQIGHFFCHLDQLITESRAILEKSRQLKKAMLTKMFPAHGETMPKVRFKGFEGEWNRVIVGELGEIVTGNTPTTSDKENYKEDGLLWVTPTDIKEPITIKTMKYLSEKGKKSARLLPANSILVTCIASIGKNTLIEECGSCNQQINALIPKKEFYPYFLLTLSEFWSEKMKKIAGSGTMDIINKTQFSEIETILPSLEEQTQIGNFFRQLDETIALQQAELEKLSQFKKGLLATMLV